MSAALCHCNGAAQCRCLVRFNYNPVAHAEPGPKGPKAQIPKGPIRISFDFHTQNKNPIQKSKGRSCGEFAPLGWDPKKEIRPPSQHILQVDGRALSGPGGEGGRGIRPSGPHGALVDAGILRTCLRDALQKVALLKLVGH